MKLVPSETSLVVAGAWNAAIVNPDWIWKYGLRKDSNEAARVQVFVPAGIGLIFDVPRFNFEGLLISVRPDALVACPKDSTPASMQEMEFFAENCISELGHTPLSGIGHNFEFRDPAPAPEFLQSFTSSYSDLMDETPDGWNVAGSTLTTSVSFESTIINITRSFDLNQLSIKFNFHHAINSKTQCLNILKGEAGYKRIHDNLLIAKDLVTKMYGAINDE